MIEERELEAWAVQAAHGMHVHPASVLRLINEVLGLRKALAPLAEKEPLAECYQDYHYRYCLHCGGESDASAYPHKDDCPWVAARARLGPPASAD